METFIKEKRNLFNEMNNNFDTLLNNIENLNDSRINDKMIFQFKYILEDILRLNDSIKDLNNNIIYNNFDSNEELDNLISEQENINKIVKDLMPLYILKSINLKT